MQVLFILLGGTWAEKGWEQLLFIILEGKNKRVNKEASLVVVIIHTLIMLIIGLNKYKYKQIVFYN